MALRITPVRSFVAGDRRTQIADVQFDSSYRTGGLSITPAQLGLTAIDVLNATVATSGQTFAYDAANGRLMAFAGGTQVADATNLATVITRVTAIGKGKAI